MEALRERLQQCTVDFLAKEDAKEVDNNAALTDAADLLMTSDSRIGLLIAEVGNLDFVFFTQVRSLTDNLT